MLQGLASSSNADASADFPVGDVASALTDPEQDFPVTTAPYGPVWRTSMGVITALCSSGTCLPLAMSSTSTPNEEPQLSSTTAVIMSPPNTTQSTELHHSTSAGLPSVQIPSMTFSNGLPSPDISTGGSSSSLFPSGRQVMSSGIQAASHTSGTNSGLATNHVRHRNIVAIIIVACIVTLLIAGLLMRRLGGWRIKTPSIVPIHTHPAHNTFTENGFEIHPSRTTSDHINEVQCAAPTQLHRQLPHSETSQQDEEKDGAPPTLPSPALPPYESSPLIWPTPTRGPIGPLVTHSDLFDNRRASPTHVAESGGPVNQPDIPQSAYRRRAEDGGIRLAGGMQRANVQDQQLGNVELHEYYTYGRSSRYYDAKYVSASSEGTLPPVYQEY